MNRKVLLIALDVTCGALIGYAVGVFMTEEKARKKYTVAAAARLRAMEIAENLQKIRAENTEFFETEVVIAPEDGTMMTTHVISAENPITDGFEPAKDNPYWTRPETKTEAPVSAVSFEPNVEGISYIEAEDFEDEDGRFKGLVTLVLGPDGPLFWLDGDPMEDWDDRLGSSFVDDFNRIHPNGGVLYVRNHKSDEDYEVIREEP